jgi:general secretion pathway protein F/type IV pilus assembly protein PilC
MVTQLNEGALGQSKARLKGDSLLTFTLQLSQLVNAGIPLYDALMVLEDQYQGESVHPTILSLAEKVKSGRSLSEAMADHPDSFDKLYQSMVTAGEASGALDIVLERLRTFLAKQIALQRQIITALIYPSVLASFSLLMILMLLGFVVPGLEAMFEGREVNTLTGAVLATSRFLKQYWWIYLPLLGAVGTAAVYQCRQPAFKLWWQGFSLRIPGLRSVVLKASLSRFARTMATLLEGGLTLVEALRISRGVIKNQVLEESLQRMEEAIIQGSSLSEELKKEPLIPKMVGRMLSVGEETGSAASMFSRIAEMYEQDVEKALTRLTALAQPVILIVMGLVVGVILLAVLLPMLDVTGFAA